MLGQKQSGKNGSVMARFFAGLNSVSTTIQYKNLYICQEINIDGQMIPVCLEVSKDANTNKVLGMAVNSWGVSESEEK